MPVDPGPSRWELPDPGTAAPGVDAVAIGGALDPPTALAGYRAGLFAMADRRRLVWYSPDPRGVIPIRGLRVSRSLRRSSRTFDVSVDHDFPAVLNGCADPARGGGQWIDTAYRRTYLRLFELGWAHSVEVWHDGRLAGGLLGVEVGGLFCGESMFHRVTDASKAAMWTTCLLLDGPGAGRRLFDVQWVTPHLASMGAVEVPRPMYLARLRNALALEAAVRPMPPRPLLELAALSPA